MPDFDTDPTFLDPFSGDDPPHEAEDDAFFSVRIEGDMGQKVQERAARLGVSAECVVRRAVQGLLWREEAERRQQGLFETRPEALTVPVVTDDGSPQTVRLLRSDLSMKWKRDTFLAATMTAHNLYSIAVQEVGGSEREKPRKEVMLRDLVRYYTSEGEGWTSQTQNTALSIPIGKLGWLINALQRAQEAVETQARINRQAAQETRRLRSSEAVQEYDKQRAVWVDKRGREAWEQAVSLANKHRASAERMGWTAHFTPWEWLVLCERFGFRCPLCGIAVGDVYPEKGGRGGMRARPGQTVRLQLHHRLELSCGGDNTIENILPLCWDCHSDVHHDFSFVLDTTPGWLAKQNALCTALTPGTLVTRWTNSERSIYKPPRYGPQPDEMELQPELTRHYPPAWPVGVVVAVTPPKPASGELAVNPWSASGFKQRYGLAEESQTITLWCAAVIQVDWHGRGTAPWASDDLTRSYPLPKDLHVLDGETAVWFREEWDKRQRRNKTAFTVGQLVRPKGRDRAGRSRIMELLPPDPFMLLPSRAVVCEMTPHKQCSTIDLADLVKVDTE